MLFSASAPGSLMLLGEYAVLAGYPALVCALDKRITVQLLPRNDTIITLSSSLGTYQTDITQIEILPPFRFVLGVLKHYQPFLKQGCDIEIISEFSDQVGFGSSAAVTVATVAVMTAWLKRTYSMTKWIRQARTIIQNVQGTGSGADVAASVLGGLVAYRMRPLWAEPLPEGFPMTVVYSGSKVPTVDAIQNVHHYFSVYPTVLKQLLRAIGMCATQGIQAAHNQQWSCLGKMMDTQQGLMHALGVNTPLLNELITSLKKDPNILGAKISGAGLGDCIVGIGAISDYQASYPNVKKMEVNISFSGVRYEKT